MALSEEFEIEHGRDQADVELSWIKQAQQGEVVAWEQVVRRYQQPVFRLAYLIMGNVEDAEEIAQDTFVRAFKALHSFDVTRPLQPWLLQITRNLSRNKRRSVGRYWAAVQRLWQTEPAARPLRETAVSGSEGEDAQLLWQAVKQCRPTAQEIIYLRYFLELSEVETAVALGIKVGTVKSRLSRAREQLRGIIERDFPELME
jgi:RNA polymerase sigma-70 factor (ECF subfamily)